MELLCIGFKGKIDEVNYILDKKIDLFVKEDLDIDRKEKQIGDTTYLSFSLDDDYKCKYNNIKSIFKHYIASGLSDIVLELYQERVINRVINDRCSYFDKLEKEKIKQCALEYLSKNDYISTEGIMYKISKRARVLKLMLEYLDLSNEINIDGFVNFRLRFFIDIIEDAIEKTIEDFIVEKEYKEFIKILQYFVEIQQPKIDLVNVVIFDETYTLYDENNELIRNDFMEEIADEMLENEMNYDDLLISSLITIAPRKIIIHSHNEHDDKQIIEILQNIFVNKSSICNECQLCTQRQNVKSKVNKERK